MKRKNILLILCIFLFPAIIYAASAREYSAGAKAAKNYMSRDEFEKSASRYIWPLGNHLITKEEFELSRGKSGASYLADGLEYWTNSSVKDNEHLIINYMGQTKSVSDESLYETRDVEFVKSNVQVFGLGTLDSPWRFDSIYEVTVKTNTKFGYIKENDVTYGIYTKYVPRGKEAKFGLKANDGQMYLSNDCNAEYSAGSLKINSVRRNITCNVVFGTGKMKVTLTGANPNILYAKYRDNYYKENYKTVVSSLTSVPSKSGYTFEGYFYNGVKVVDKDKTVIRSSIDEIDSDVTIAPTYSVNSPSSPTISGGTTIVTNKDDVTLKCATTSTPPSGADLYYSFGYSTTEDGTIGNWTEASKTNSLKLSKSNPISTRWYSCKAYIDDGSIRSDAVLSTNKTKVEIVNARISFNPVGGKKSSGSNPAYVKYESSSLYTGRTNTEAASAPVAVKDGYTFLGWYTSDVDGTLVIDASGGIKASVSGWTNSSGKWILTRTENTDDDKILYAHYKSQTFTKSLTWKSQGNVDWTYKTGPYAGKTFQFPFDVYFSGTFKREGDGHVYVTYSVSGECSKTGPTNFVIGDFYVGSHKYNIPGTIFNTDDTWFSETDEDIGEYNIGDTITVEWVPTADKRNSWNNSASGTITLN